MSKYKVKFIFNITGKGYFKEIEAPSKAVAEQKIYNEFITIISAEPVSKKGDVDFLKDFFGMK